VAERPLLCVLQVILPEGSTDLAAAVPFPVAQSRDVRYTYLDTVGRPVLVLQKQNVVMEHNQHFQVAITAQPAQRWHAKLALHACLAQPLQTCDTGCIVPRPLAAFIPVRSGSDACIKLIDSMYSWHGMAAFSVYDCSQYALGALRVRSPWLRSFGYCS
jgi:hypothetical protein